MEALWVTKRYYRVQDARVVRDDGCAGRDSGAECCTNHWYTRLVGLPQKCEEFWYWSRQGHSRYV